jgi:nuclear distribution protein NudE
LELTELDDFQTSSRELEEELEKELAATEKQQADLRDKISKLEVEKEEWKVRLAALDVLLLAQSSMTGHAALGLVTMN